MSHTNQVNTSYVGPPDISCQVIGNIGIKINRIMVSSLINVKNGVSCYVVSMMHTGIC